MIRYTKTVSGNAEDGQGNVSYGLKATNEKGEDVLEVPAISSDEKVVEYLVERFNQVRMNRDSFR